jgi:photosystem II stability/assembly factor-like uncharacterized protein
MAAAGAAVPSRQLATVQMLGTNVGVGLTTTFVERCRATPTPQTGCNVVTTARPLSLVVTSDGGRHWKVSGRPVPSPGGTKATLFGEIAFSSPTDGYVAVGGALLYTANGGHSWRPVALARQLESLTRAGTTAWVVLRNCRSRAAPKATCPTAVAKTTAVGTLTGRYTVPVSGVDLVGAPTSSVAVFEDAGDEHSMWLVATTNGGRSWARHLDPCPFGAGSLAGTDAWHWWLLCAQGIGMNQAIVDLYATADGGASWARVASAGPQKTSGNGLSDASPQEFVISPDGRRLWIVGVNFLETSTDAGLSWAPVPGVNLGGAIADIDTLPPQRAWVAAPNSGLWATLDGSNWRALGPTGLPNS